MEVTMCKVCKHRHHSWEPHVLPETDTQPVSPTASVPTASTPVKNKKAAVGRPRIYANATERKDAWRKRKKSAQSDKPSIPNTDAV